MAETVNKDTSSIVKKWYVVRAISGQEKKVKQYIEVEINRLKLNDYVSQVLIPTEKFIQIRNGKKTGLRLATKCAVDRTIFRLPILRSQILVSMC